MTIVILQQRQHLRIPPRNIAAAESQAKALVSSTEALRRVSSDYLSDFDEVLVLDEWSDEAVAALVRGLPAPAHFITNDEYCLELCARLRGQPDAELDSLETYRDKVLMKERVAEAGIRVPLYYRLDHERCSQDADLYSEELVRQLGLPVVVKPVRESNNRGVAVLSSHAALHAWMIRSHDSQDSQAATSVQQYEIEQYIEGTLHHANLAVVGGRATCLLVAEYLSPPLMLSAGLPSGSITLPRQDVRWGSIADLSMTALRALGSAGDGVTHVELFQAQAGELIFLEAAHRAPGALVSEVGRRHIGRNLEELNLSLQLGEPWPGVQPDIRSYAAWLWFPRMPMEPQQPLPTLRSKYSASWLTSDPLFGSSGSPAKPIEPGLGQMLLENTCYADLRTDFEALRRYHP